MLYNLIQKKNWIDIVLTQTVDLCTCVSVGDILQAVGLSGQPVVDREPPRPGQKG